MFFRKALSIVSPAGQRARLSIFIFHRVLPQPDPLFPDEPCVRRFEEMMGWLAGWFNVLPLDEAVERLHSGLLPARAAAITFDDGYADNLLHATPILKKHGLTATFFISTGFLDGGVMWNDIIIESLRLTTLPELDASRFGLGRLPLASIENKRSAIDKLITAIKHLPAAARHEAVEYFREACSSALPDDLMLTTQQLRELNFAGMSIGAHTVSHPILAQHPDAAARREIADSRDFLEGLLKERVPLFAYPNGKLGRDYLPKHVEMTRELGFTAAVSTNWGVSTEGSDLYQLPRFTPWERSRLGYCTRLLRNYLPNQA